MLQFQYSPIYMKGNVSRTNRTEPMGVLGVRLSERSDEPEQQNERTSKRSFCLVLIFTERITPKTPIG
ncbi:MAG: hypothetical protein LBM69_05510, partial [Lachnospiraceae bacterium]|nr:hypothetical protein [Lachnospiraceae bacterium]